MLPPLKAWLGDIFLIETTWRAWQGELLFCPRVRQPQYRMVGWCCGMVSACCHVKKWGKSLAPKKRIVPNCLITEDSCRPDFRIPERKAVFVYFRFPVNSYPRQVVLCQLVPKSTRTQYQLVRKTTRTQYQVVPRVYAFVVVTEPSPRTNKR